MSERVEWEVLHVTPAGKIVCHSEGAQARFGLARAKEIAKKLGPPWVVNHFYTLTPPDQYGAWLQNLPAPARQRFEAELAANPEPHSGLMESHG